MAIITLRVYQALRAMHVKPAMAYRLAYLGDDRTVSETNLLLTAQQSAV